MGEAVVLTLSIIHNIHSGERYGHTPDSCGTHAYLSVGLEGYVLCRCWTSSWIEAI